MAPRKWQTKHEATDDDSNRTVPLIGTPGQENGLNRIQLSQPKPTNPMYVLRHAPATRQDHDEGGDSIVPYDAFDMIGGGHDPEHRLFPFRRLIRPCGSAAIG